MFPDIFTSNKNALRKSQLKWLLFVLLAIAIITLSVLLAIRQRPQEKVSNVEPSGNGEYPGEAELQAIMAQAEAESDAVKPTPEEVQKVFEVLIQEEKAQGATQPTPEEMKAVFESAQQPVTNQ